MLFFIRKIKKYPTNVEGRLQLLRLSELVWVCSALRSCRRSTFNLSGPAGLSRKARQGSAEMSGCYRDSPTSTSTEKYRMVKERQGGREGGCQSRNGHKMNGGEGGRGAKDTVRVDSELKKSAAKSKGKKEEKIWTRDNKGKNKIRIWNEKLSCAEMKKFKNHSRMWCHSSV